MPLTPPYDARPAVSQDIDEIRELLIDNFGEEAAFVKVGDIVILNHVGSEDQMDEIIYFGTRIGVRRYDLLSKQWKLKLDKNGLILIDGKCSKRWVTVVEGAKDKILEGANLLIPGVINADPDIKKGDYIVIMDSDRAIIAGGIAKIDESERKSVEKGVYAKNYSIINKTYSPPTKEISWEEVIRWNKKQLENIERESIWNIRTIKEDLKLPVVVSFSGGKDSLVTLTLVNKALNNEEFKILFVDTGIEFPETVQYVNESIEYFGLEDRLIIEKVDSNLFWDSFEKFGPPARDFRYCCKFAKLGPIRKALERERFGEQFISFVGQRRYESYRRASSEIWQNQYVPNQINISPIQNWTAFVIWLYIYWQNLPYNPLYNEGYERIGCWTCPSSNMSQMKILKKNHTKLYEKLHSALIQWQSTRDLPEEYLTLGLWRFKQIPKKILNIVSLPDVSEKVSQATDLSSLQVVQSECKSDPTTIIGAFSTNISIDRTSNTLNILGDVKVNKKLQYLQVKDKNSTTLLFSDGSFKITLKNKPPISKNFVKKTISNFVLSVLRSLECSECGLCVSECEKGAIKIVDKMLIVDPNLCNHCENCFSVCPIVTIIHRELTGKISEILKKELQFTYLKT